MQQFDLNADTQTWSRGTENVQCLFMVYLYSSELTSAGQTALNVYSIFWLRLSAFLFPTKLSKTLMACCSVLLAQPLTQRCHCPHILSHPSIQQSGAPPQANETQTRHFAWLSHSFSLPIHLLFRFSARFNASLLCQSKGWTRVYDGGGGGRRSKGKYGKRFGRTRDANWEFQSAKKQ